MYSIVEGRVRSCQCSKKMVSRVATDLRNMRGEESVMEPCLWTFRDENGVILCAWCTSMTSCWRAATFHLENVCDCINNLYEW